MNGNYTIDDKIKSFPRPKKTVLKLNKKTGRTYVYEYSKVKDNNGKWKNVYGKEIGYIDPEKGFISNAKSIVLSSDRCYDFGIYALIFFLCNDLLERLKKYFNDDDAIRLFSLASIHFAEEYLPIKYLPEKYKNSLFGLLFPDLKMGEKAISNIYFSLGKKGTHVIDFQNDLIKESSSKIAIDGHAISSNSINNDLCAKGNKLMAYKNGQLNVMMAYDIISKMPLLSKIYEGDAKDNKSFQDFISSFNFSNTLFVIDKGFYSKTNLELFSKNNCKYIIPLLSSCINYKKLTSDMNLDYQNDIFIYGKKNISKTIVYKKMKINDCHCYIFRDIDENAKECADYKTKMNLGFENYTLENFEKYKDQFGTLFLQTNYDVEPEEIFTLYKNRWSIETFYNTYKYQLNINQLDLHDYYQIEGLSFILLLSSIIDSMLRNRLKNSRCSTIKNLTELRIEANYLKIQNINGRWSVLNLISKRQAEFENLGLDFTKINDYLNF